MWPISGCFVGISGLELLVAVSLLTGAIIPWILSLLFLCIQIFDHKKRFHRFPKRIGRYRLSPRESKVFLLSVLLLWTLLLRYWIGFQVGVVVLKFDFREGLAPYNVEMCNLKLEHFSGSGLWRDVSSARWRGKKVAIKRQREHKNSASSDGMLMDWMNSRVARVDAWKEAAIGSLLTGTNNTVQVLGYCPDTYTVIVEWGNELTCAHKSTNREGDRLQLQVLADMAGGLEDFHSIGMIHGDIKLSNFRTRSLSSGPPRVLLGDFNRAMTPFSQGYTCQAVAKGPWRSPEEYKEEPFTVAADVFSMAVTMWCWLNCAERPYPRVSEASVPDKVGAGGLIPDVYSVHMFDPQVESAVRNLLQRCLANSPSDRPTARMVKIEFDQIAQLLH